MQKKTRIAVIGGGASGLTAAWMLREKGYRHVTVFEKESHVGGKCKTVSIANRSYELGAILHLSGTEPIASLIREFGLDTFDGTVVPQPDPRQSPLFDFRAQRPFAYPKRLRAFAAAIRFSVMTLFRPEICCPGHENISEDLAVPLSDWLERNGLSSLQLLFSCWMSGFGYGYSEQIPAAYALKFCNPRMIWRSLLDDGLVSFSSGYQNLWARVAERLDIRLGHAVTRITRGDRVIVAAENAEFEFDKVILCCDLRTIAPALDLDEEESELIGRIRNHRFHAVIAEVENMPSRVAFVTDHFSDRLPGAIVSWYQRWSERNLFNLYAISTDKINEEEVHRRIDQNVRDLGGKFVRVISSQNWNYFPCVSHDDLKAGFYRRLEARQGQRNTFYAGEVMHFPSADLLAAYSAQLVERHFA